ncbi:MAG: serine/threonine-protein kinase [Planctomycetota bacterium]
MSAVIDRDLLLGILTNELGIVDRDHLVAAMNTWKDRREKPLADVLLEAGRLNAEQRAWLLRAVDRQLQRHGGAQAGPSSLWVQNAVDELIKAGASPDLAAGLTTLVLPLPSLSAGERVGSSTVRTDRYEILRHHASGGLGEVFLARDSELHRDVALKEIRPQYADDEELRARFVLEAEITGGLEHPNIVPVHGLGKDQDDRPFYIMRFIRGESFQEAITRFHSKETAAKPPGERILMLRKLLGCFVDVCNAAAYAHSRGVIHRDLKPDNVMLGPYGETLLLDWGLAKLVQRDQQAVSAQQKASELAPQPSTLHPAAAGSPTPTRVGSIVGTLGYMSPEQAAGLVDQLGPASDIYSLGAILYAVLTGSAPFGGSSSDQVRQQIIAGRYRSPRQVNAQVSPALEAICRNAMSQDPCQRYATVRELADDVEAWLADEPVRAWREPWAARTGRWIRRHRTLVGSGMAAVLAATVSLTIGVLLLTAANEREHAAKIQAEKQRQQARQNFQMARDAVDKYLTRVSDDPRLKAHDLERLRRDLLETARDFYEQFIRQQSDDPDLRAAWAWAHFRLASIMAEIGSKQRAAELLQQALGTFAALAREHSERADYRYGELQTQLNLARVFSEITLPQQAAAALASARELADALLARNPQDAAYRAALAAVYSTAARLCIERKDYGQAETEYRAAIDLRVKLLKESPAAAEQQSLLARDETGLAILYRRQNRRDEATKLLFSAADRHSRLVDADRDVPEYLMDLANACDNLATFYGDVAGNPQQIEAAYQHALAVRRQLLRAHPEVAQYQAGVAGSHFSLAALYCRTGQFKKGEQAYLIARQMFEQLADEHPDVPDYRDTLGAVMNNQALLYRAQDRHEEAIAALKSAIDIRQKLTRESPDSRHYLQRLGSSCVNLGDTLGAKNRTEEADAAYRQAAGVYEKLTAKFSRDMDAVLELGSLYCKMGQIALEQGKPQNALVPVEKAQKLIQSRSSTERKLPGAKAVLLSALWCQAGACAASGDYAGAAAAAGELAPSCKKQGAALYRLAAVWAMASTAAGKDAKLSPTTGSRLAEQYAAAAVAALADCRDTSFFKDAGQAKLLLEDSKLEGLRGREDFKRLLARPPAP